MIITNTVYEIYTFVIITHGHNCHSDHLGNRGSHYNTVNKFYSPLYSSARVLFIFGSPLLSGARVLYVVEKSALLSYSCFFHS